MAERQYARTQRMWIALAISLLALVGGAPPTVSGQSPREWRDYAGGPDSSRFVAATEITKANVHQLRWRGRYPPGQTDFNPLVVRGVVYGRGANGSFVALDAATGKAALDPRGRPGFQRSRRELLGEQGRQGPPPDLQREQLPPGDRRADRPGHLRRSASTAASTCASGWTGIPRRSTSRAACRAGSSRT